MGLQNNGSDQCSVAFFVVLLFFCNATYSVPAMQDSAQYMIYMIVIVTAVSLLLAI